MENIEIYLEPRVELLLQARIAELEQQLRDERHKSYLLENEKIRLENEKIRLGNDKNALQSQLTIKDEHSRRMMQQVLCERDRMQKRNEELYMENLNHVKEKKSLVKDKEKLEKDVARLSDRKRGRENILANDLGKKMKICEEQKAQVASLKTELNHSKQWENPRKDYDNLNCRESKNRRMNMGMDHLKKLAGGEPTEQYYKDQVDYLSKKGHFKSSLTDQEAYAIYHKVGLTRSTYQGIRAYLKAKNVPNPFPSLRAIRREEKLHGSKNLFHVDVHDAADGSKIVVTQLIDLKKFIVKKLELLASSNKLLFDESTGRKIWCCISGDKGGREFKLCATIGNVAVPNSSYHIIPLGMFNGDENLENILTYLRKTIEQVNELREVELNVNGVTETFEIVHFLGGDLKYQYQMLGHTGSTSKMSCLHCYDAGRKNISKYVRGTCHKPRSRDDYIRDSVKGNNNVYKGTKIVFSNVGMNRIIPPPLHIVMGLAQRYGFTVLLNMAMEIDNKSGIAIDGKKQKAMKKVKGILAEKKQQYQELEEHLTSFDVVVDVIKRFRNSSIQPSTSQQTACSAEWCLFRDVGMTRASVFKSTPLQCACCFQTSHAVCSGVWTLEDWKLLDLVEPDFDCLRCSNRSGILIEKDAIAVQKDMTEALEKLKTDLELVNGRRKGEDEYESNYRLAQNNYDSLVMALKGRGTKRIELENVWSSLGADMSAWQQNFTGNHTQKLLKEAAIDKYMDFFPQSHELKHMKQFLLALGRIAQKCTPKSFNDSEIDEFDDLINTMWHHLQQFRPSDTITPKLHSLLEHVVPFMKEHKTWAKTSEQGLEALHAVVNRLRNKYRTIRSEEQKMEYVFCGLLHLNFINNYL